MCESSGRNGGGGLGKHQAPSQAEDPEGRRADLPTPPCLHTEEPWSSRVVGSLRDPRTTPCTAARNARTTAGSGDLCATSFPGRIVLCCRGLPCALWDMWQHP